jgi:hypothetical protein
MKAEKISLDSLLDFCTQRGPRFRELAEKYGTTETGAGGDPSENSRPVSGRAAARETKKNSGASLSDVTLPPEIKDLADWTLRDIIGQFGTDIAFLDFLRALKEIETIDEKRLKNAKAKGELVHRDLVKIGIIDPIDAAHRKILSDGTKTMAKRAMSMVLSGTTAQDLEAFFSEHLSSFIRPVKTKVHRAFKNVQQQPEEDRA